MPSTRILLPCVLGMAALLGGTTERTVRGQSKPIDAAAIADLLQPRIAAHDGDVAVSLRVLDDAGDVRCQWDYRGDEVKPTASLIKLAIMITAYQQSAAGQLALDDRIELTEEDKVPGSGILTEHFSAGATFSLRDAIRLMMRYSDNTATNLVVDRLGLEATTQLMAELGMPETQLHSKVFLRSTSIAPKRSEKFGLGSTTANDMVELLTRIEQRKLVSTAACEQMLEHLLSCEDRTKIPRMLPAECRVAHKTGAVSRARTDAGIVYFDGGKFVLCVLTNNNADASWSDDNAANILCGAIAHDLYQLVAKPNAESVGPAPLAQGSTGTLVEALQRTLNDRISAKLSVDGDFGPATESAVRQFQQQNDLPVTGVVKARTWQALGELLTEAEPVPPPSVVNSQVLERQPPLDPLAPPHVSAKAWTIVDLKSGESLAERSSNERLPNASTTKVMTALLALELAESDPRILEETVTFSRRADATGGSTSGVAAGEQLSLLELLYGLLLPSGNDAAVAVAEHLGDRVPISSSQPEEAAEGVAEEGYVRFIAAMNARAEELGMVNTRYVNPHGLTEEGHFSSATDLAKLAAAAWQMPRMREIINCRQRGCQLTSVNGYVRNVVWENTNRLLEQDGFVGMKTGTTNAAGACLIAIGSRAGQHYLVVLLGSTDSAARYRDARNLFAWTWRQP